MKNPNHHIIPDYKCKELGIITSYKIDGVEFYFKENYLPNVTREDHALIHWGYYCNDLEPLFKYVTPAQWIIDLIPIGDLRDMWAAKVTGRNEIDGIDMSGENSPNWKGGKWLDDPNKYMREYARTPKQKEYRKKLNTQPKHRARRMEYYEENKEYLNEKGKEWREKNKEKCKEQRKVYQSTPEFKVKNAERARKYRQTPKGMAYQKKCNADWRKKNPDYHKEYQAKKRAALEPLIKEAGG